MDMLFLRDCVTRAIIKYPINTNGKKQDNLVKPF